MIMFPNIWFGLDNAININWESPFNTHLPLDKMDDNLADVIFKPILLNENVWISIKISLNFVAKDPNVNKLALLQVMTCRRTGDKPLPEPMMTRFIDVYMRHQGEMS